jgi:hypothetical protein
MTPIATLLPQTVEEIVNRAGRPDFDRWTEQLARCGHCSRPIRLRGRIEHQSAHGRQLTYSTETEPDRVLLIRCGNRRPAAHLLHRDRAGSGAADPVRQPPGGGLPVLLV